MKNIGKKNSILPILPPIKNSLHKSIDAPVTEAEADAGQEAGSDAE